jgi:hypothetical protein
MGRLKRGLFLPRLVCRRCAATVWPGVMRCPTCGALSPTSEIRAAILSPSAFVLVGLLALIVTLGFW